MSIIISMSIMVKPSFQIIYAANLEAISVFSLVPSVSVLILVLALLFLLFKFSNVVLKSDQHVFLIHH